MTNPEPPSDSAEPQRPEPGSAPVPAESSDDLYRLIFDAALDGLSIVNREGIVVDVNPALGKIDGYARDETIGQFPPRYRDPSEHEAFRKLLDRVLSGNTVEAEVFLPHKNGTRRPAETRSARIIYHGEPHMLIAVRDLSERQEHEGELRRVEDRYRAMFEASVDGLCVIDSAGNVVDVNPALPRVDGFSREELIGQYPPTFREPGMREAHRKYISIVLEKGALESEAELLRKDGSRYTAELRSVRIEYQGKPQILVIIRDISERRARELELVRREDQYRTVFEGMIDGLALIRSDGIIVDVNQAMLELDGWEREELVGHLPPTYVGDEDRIAAHLEYVRRVLAREHVKKEFYFERKDGTHYFAEVRPIRVNQNGEAHVLLVIRNISKQKAQHAALARSEDRLRATVETALDSIIVMNEVGEIVDFNPAAEACFGYTAEEVIGRPLEDVVIPPYLRDAHRNGLKNYLETGEGPYLGTRIEVDAMRKDGSVLQTELAISVANGADGRLFIGYLRDITEVKRAAEQSELLEAQLRQAQKMEAIGHLTGGIAHDFNNILTSVLGYVTLARDRSGSQRDEKLDRYLERAERAGGRARDLIAQMMTFSRGQQGEREEVDVVRLVDESLTLLESSLPASIEMTVSLPQELPTISIDPVHFEQILVNLCINARDAMNGVGKLTVTLSASDGQELVCNGCREAFNGRYIELAVADSGPGIDAAIVERIFEPFFTTKDIGKGSGMGLSTVHGIVHDHAGHALVDTGLGVGTTMRVLLPMGVSGSAAVPGSVPRVSNTDDKPLSGRVLIVDDNAEVAEYLDDLLQTWGLEVTIYHDPIAARDRVIAEPALFDLVVTDQTMPRMSGLELATAIGAVSPDLPVFLYTGFSETVTEEIALAAGVRAFLQKPLDTSRLATLVGEVLG